MLDFVPRTEQNINGLEDALPYRFRVWWGPAQAQLGTMSRLRGGKWPCLGANDDQSSVTCVCHTLNAKLTSINEHMLG